MCVRASLHATQTYKRDCVSGREQLQQWFVAQDKLFERCLVRPAIPDFLIVRAVHRRESQVPIRRLHTALLLTSFEEHQLAAWIDFLCAVF